MCIFFFFQAEDGIRDYRVTGVQTCALPITRLNSSHTIISYSSFSISDSWTAEHTRHRRTLVLNKRKTANGYFGAVVLEVVAFTTTLLTTTHRKFCYPFFWFQTW